MRVRRLLARSLRCGWRHPVRVVLCLLVPGLLVTGLLLAVAVFFTLDALFPFPCALLAANPQSPRVTARDGVPLLQTVASDDQVRIPVALEQIDRRIIEATIAVEDERFHRHFGVDPLSVVRACGQNLAAGEVVSGASTLTMQLCRMIQPRPRTFRSKAIETFRALQLECRLEKDEILEQYLNRASYGGNLVGVEAAARRYFGRGAQEVSLAEAALLAGLPQGPAILHPVHHPERALRRRSVVLARLAEEGFITAAERQSADREPLVLCPEAIDRVAPHAAWLALLGNPSGGQTTIDVKLQRALAGCISAAHHLPEHIQLAAVVIEIETGAIRALVGSRDFSGARDGQVNGALARRSPGSTLKPFAYAHAFATGRLTPGSLLPDRPIERGGWRPRNFDGRFRGQVTATDALRNSLNVPAILLAERLGLGATIDAVERAGVALPADAHRRGGLAVVTGALEVTLLDLTDGYATLGRRGRVLPATLRAEVARRRRTSGAQGREVFPQFACLEIDAILGRRTRGSADAPWFMAKTGTSSRRRDAWAVGHNGRFAIGVWAGRFPGGGDPQLVGALAAMPVLERAFATPEFAVIEPSPAPRARTATRPIQFLAADDGPLRIVSPASGARWIALDGPVQVRVSAEGGSGGNRWLLDGRPVNLGRHGTLSVEAGDHELRIVDSAGEVAIVRFRILGTPPQPRQAG